MLGWLSVWGFLTSLIEKIKIYLEPDEERGGGKGGVRFFQSLAN